MSKIKESGFNLLPHTGKSIYANKKSDNMINSFCLFNKTISSIFCQKQNCEFSFESMKNCDKMNIEKLKFNSSNEHSSYNLRRKNFLENSFYEDILKNKETYENLYKDTNFRMLQNEDKSNSALYYHINIINQFKDSGSLENTKSQMIKKLNNITENEKKNCVIISDEFICRELGKDNYYKRVKANGNSFYISFAYQYIKYLVQKGEESLISEIFYIMDKELNIMNYNNVNIKDEELGQMYISKSIKNNELNDLLKMFCFFSLIYTNIMDKKIDEAEKMLEYAFKYEESFGNFFTLFMKLRINHFISINKEIFTYEKYCKNIKLIDEIYYEDGKFLYEKYVNNNLLINQMEPSLFIISLVPFVFNASMNLYINEINNYFKKICFDLKENSQANISIFYSTYSYHIIENNLVDNNTLRDFDLSNTLDLKKSYFKNFNKNDYIFIEDKKCNICNSHNFIRFLKKFQIIKSSICLNCLKRTINEILIKRYDKMISEKFKYLEFYLRDIPLSSIGYNEFVFLSPPEFYCLFECNIYTYFMNLIISLCDLCRKYNNKIITKDCGCKRCLDCAKKEINKNLVLTNFDKHYLKKNDYMICQCNIKSSIVKYSEIINDNLDKEEKMSLNEKINKIIHEQFKSYCMLCGNKLNNNKISGESLRPEKLKVKLNGKLIDHYICLKCDRNNLSNICIICEQKHEIDKYQINENQEKDNDKKPLKNVINNTNKEESTKTKNTKKRNRKQDTFCSGKCIIY